MVFAVFIIVDAVRYDFAIAARRVVLHIGKRIWFVLDTDGYLWYNQRIQYGLYIS